MFECSFLSQSVAVLWWSKAPAKAWFSPLPVPPSVVLWGLEAVPGVEGRPCSLLWWLRHRGSLSHEAGPWWGCTREGPSPSLSLVFHLSLSLSYTHTQPLPSRHVHSSGWLVLVPIHTGTSPPWPGPVLGFKPGHQSRCPHQPFFWCCCQSAGLFGTFRWWLIWRGGFTSLFLVGMAGRLGSAGLFPVLCGLRPLHVDSQQGTWTSSMKVQGSKILKDELGAGIMWLLPYSVG